MKKKLLVPLLISTLLWNLVPSLTLFAQQDSESFENPVIWADVPDPDVIRVGDVYYMTSTTMHMNPGVPIMKSKDLVNWEIVNYVYDILDDGDKQALRNGQNEYGAGSWASSLRYHNGTFYVAFASNTTGKTYIFQTSDIENGKWTKSTLDGLYHDPSLLFDDGHVYMVYGSGDIRVIELTSDATAIKEGGLNKVIIPDASLVAGPNVGLPAEGSHVLKINGKYYVFLITWPKGGSRTQLVFRADSIDGEYEGRIALDDSGIAQGGIIDTVDGDWYAFLFQDHGSVGRIPFLVPVSWEDGWPIFGEDGKVPQEIRIPAGDTNLKNSIVSSDEFYQGSKKISAYHTKTKTNGENDYNGSNLSLVWQWNHNPDNNNWSLTERPGYLRLTNGRKSTNILDARNTLTQRTFGPECSGYTAMDISNMKDGDFAGLAAFQKNYGFVGVKMSGGSKSIVMVNGSSGSPQEIESIPITQDRVYFKIDFDYKNKTDKAYFYYSLNGVEWTAIGNTLQMTYTIPHFMGYRFALFNYATKTTGGFVDFDYFRIDDKLTGTDTSATILKAYLEDVSDVVGAPNIKFKVPVKMDALPEGEYSSISASFNIPENLTVTGVEFNSENIDGDSSYTFSNNRLQLNVSGDDVNFSNHSSNLFATINFKVDDFVPSDRTDEIRTDYINVDGGNVVYDVHDAVANIGLKQLDTEALAKIPGYANPLISHKYGADPYAIVHEGRVYIYMTSDAYEYDQDGNIIDNTYSQIKSITVISSADMINWTDHGEIPIAGPDGIAKWANNSWAPAVAHKKINGKDKFFLYFSNNASNIGVLTADSPIGPWTDPLGEPVIDRDTPGTDGVVWIFDPAVLVDDDGTGYLYFGGGIPGGSNPSQEQIANPKTARVIKLSEDMIHTEGEAKLIDSPFHFEDSGIHKYNGKYYYSYCSNFSGIHPEGTPGKGEIAYMVSDKPMGPFTYVGTILKNPYEFFEVGGNNHHAIFEFNNQWYITYHAQTLGKAKGYVKGYRSTHINEVEYYENGFIKEVEADMEGVSQVANLNPYKRTEAETIAWSAGISTEKSEAPGSMLESLNLNVTDINNGDWLAVSNVDFGENGTKTFEANIASAVRGKIEIRLDSPIGEVIGTLDVKRTGGERKWKPMETDVKNVKGVHNIFFMFIGEDKNNLFNIDYWKFTENKVKKSKKN
ncbi:family 43 glycosylhydrolase [Paenactinomyces guangxiensis]|uniref:Family 43 glycosylhydrolase n=1 Tax=Paenactinomyces guangxiensis TaxID=1490290 RepID=A0A7W1WVC7_9BACL|nr:family 43 glycosylhydrolase [Paenactinomyces guangxiensis]MBA4496526.1 family 43 glycosylhydrolase [Paenactinomyces guangxiensis]MBH8593548.1 family 43 glycosylhydrolase [Paenactinomyces guangxiensis]